MLAPEALRLVTIEVLRPTAAVEADDGYPTVARGHVYDSREIPVQDIDRDRRYTPVISVHSNEARITPRGEASSLTDVQHQAVLDIVVELAIVSSDEGGEFVDCIAGTDPEAKLVLGALCSKIRFLLERSQDGAMPAYWRRLVKRVVSLEAIPFAVPDIGIRFQRVTLRYTVELMADVYDLSEDGLPQPLRGVYEALPAGSYARRKLAELAGYFKAEDPPGAIEGIVATVLLPGGTELTAGDIVGD